jgi:hypothetical protein
MNTCIRAGAGARGCPQPVGYRIRSSAPVWGALWPAPGACEAEVRLRCIAISIAAKCRTAPGASIEVVHVDSGQLVFEKPMGGRSGEAAPA